MNALKTKALVTVIISLSVIMLYLGSQMFMSGLYSMQTNLFLQDWHSKQTQPNDQAWSTAHQASLNAKQSHPVNDAFIEEQIGKVLQWNTYYKTINEPSALAERQAALDAYRKQAQLTPNWPNAWFNLLSSKIELSQFDDEFYQAYQIAEQTTKQTPNTHTQFVLINVQAWQQMNNPTKSNALKLFVAEAATSPKHSQDIRQLLEAYNLLQITCIYANVSQQNTFNLCHGFV